MSKPNIYPHELDNYAAKALFRGYVQANRAMLDETYGTWWDDGNGSKKSWCYYDVDAHLLGPDKVKFTTYGMEDSFHGGRGVMNEELISEYKPEELANLVAYAQMKWAQREYKHRQAEASRLEVQRGIAAVYAELFGGGL